MFRILFAWSSLVLIQRVAWFSPCGSPAATVALREEVWTIAFRIVVASSAPKGGEWGGERASGWGRHPSCP